MFAVDNGFTKFVSGDCLTALPEDLMDIAPQVKMFNQFSNRRKFHKYVNYDHPGECSPEKDCLR